MVFIYTCSLLWYPCSLCSLNNTLVCSQYPHSRRPLLKEIVSYISAYQFGICHTSKVILPHVLENTSLVLVSPPHYIMPYVEIEILNVTIYVSLVACMSVGRVLTHTDICACLIRVRGMTWAWPNPLRLPYPCCHTLLYTPQTITPCPYWSKLWFYKPAD